MGNFISKQDFLDDKRINHALELLNEGAFVNRSSFWGTAIIAHHQIDGQLKRFQCLADSFEEQMIDFGWIERHPDKDLVITDVGRYVFMENTVRVHQVYKHPVMCRDFPLVKERNYDAFLNDYREWLNKNIKYCDMGNFLTVWFKNRQDALLFKMVWG